MSVPGKERRTRKQHTLNVDLGEDLLQRVEMLRREIGDACDPPRRLSLGDVVRLGVHLLEIRVRLHEWNTGPQTKENWQRVLDASDALEQIGGWPAYILLPLSQIQGMGTDMKAKARAGKKQTRSAKPKN